MPTRQFPILVRVDSVFKLSRGCLFFHLFLQKLMGRFRVVDSIDQLSRSIPSDASEKECIWLFGETASNKSPYGSTTSLSLIDGIPFSIRSRKVIRTDKC